MGDDYPPLRVPLPPGMTVDKDCSDSDPEVQAEFKRNRAARDRRHAEREAAEKQAEEAAAARAAEEATKELLLQGLDCCAQHTAEGVHKLLADTGRARPEGFQERLDLAEGLCKEAKERFAEGDTA